MGSSSGGTELDVGRPPVRRSRLRRFPWKKAVLWVLMSACVAFVLYAAWGLLQAIDDLNGPPDGDWLCSGHSRTCEP